MMHVTMDNERHPIFGILLSPDLADKVPNEPPGAAIMNLMDAVDQTGISAFCFALRDVHIEQMTIAGWVREGGQWSLRTVAWPDVFYDQDRHALTRVETRALQALYTSAVPINTARILGKYFTYSMLERYADVKPMLPETILYQQPEDLRVMLDRHRSVYVKPEWGSNGVGISRVWMNGDGSYGWRGAVSKAERSSCTLEEAAELLRQEAGRNLLVVQQEIPLFRIEGRPSDMRIGVRKDRSGQWRFDQARTRVMAPEGITTNWARGGAWLLFPDGLDCYVSEDADAEQLWQRIEKAALTIALRLEESVGPMGELGFDLGFDHDLNLWLVEANPMPNLPIYDTVDGVIDPVYTRTVGYAIYLYEQQRTHSAERA